MKKTSNNTKFLRKDVEIAITGIRPIDMNDKENATSAIALTLPTRFSQAAKKCWEYLDGTAFIYAYKGKLVVTDESRWLTLYGDGTKANPAGGPRMVCNSWKELEKMLEAEWNAI